MGEVWLLTLGGGARLLDLRKLEHLVCGGFVQLQHDLPVELLRVVVAQNLHELKVVEDLAAGRCGPPVLVVLP